MKFVSTRGGEKVTGTRAIVNGLSENGGLYVPEKFPEVSAEELSGMLSMSYAERAAHILSKYFDEFAEDELVSCCESAYSGFGGKDPAPLVNISENTFILELFHGPTCAFSDMSLALFPDLLKKSREVCGIMGNILVLAASSGDTGKSALEIFKNAEGVKVMVFYPSDGVSKMQKIQLGTQEGENVNVVAVRGTFDDCQAAVKDILLNKEYAQKLSEKGYTIFSANSLNIARIIPQIAFYFSAYLDLLSSGKIEQGEEIDFCVPTGNFASAVAGYYAKRMGLPVRRLHCASNLNHVLTDFFKTGVYDSRRELYKTTSPSMDILVSTNVERLIFEVSGRNSKLTAKRMQELKDDGKYSVTEEELKTIGETFDGGFANEDECVEAMYFVFEDTGYTMDTHTGCAMRLAYQWAEKNKKDETKKVVIATANPYKFPQDVLYAVTGNDVKDSFKGVKRLHAATAMAVPKVILKLRDKPIRFSRTVDKKKLLDEISEFVK